MLFVIVTNIFQTPICQFDNCEVNVFHGEIVFICMIQNRFTHVIETEMRVKKVKLTSYSYFIHFSKYNTTK